MSELYNRIWSIIKKHPEFEEVSARKELDYLTEENILDDVMRLYITCEKEDVVWTGNDQNSLIAYLMGSTLQKPSGEMKIPRRRTYARAGFPDVDMDFDYLLRNKVIAYVKRKYGEDYVAHIGLVAKIKTRSAVKNAIKVLDPEHSTKFDSLGKKIKSESTYALETEVVNTLPLMMKRKNGTFVKNIEEACEEYPEFKKYMEAYPDVRKVASAIEGTISGFGVHAAGILISPIPLAQICPLHTTSKQDELGNKVLATQYYDDDVERLGLIKFDFLGVRTRSSIELACRYIKESYGTEINWKEIGLQDRATLDLINTGKTVGCFQLESRGMQESLKVIGIDTFEDLMVAVAMYRPGPIDWIPKYAEYKKNPQSVRYAHPIIRKHTEDTFGIIVYQEQAMLIFVELADLTTSDGYLFIKGAAKKNPTLFQSMKDRFIKGVSKKASKEVAEAVWRKMEPFQGYAFNRSHTLGYAFEAYKTAYLKRHYTTEFFAARLTVETLSKSFTKEQECLVDAINNFKFKIEEPDLQTSKMHWTILGEHCLRKPLLIKGVGEKVVKKIIDNQPYDTKDLLFSFVKKNKGDVNKRTMEAMYECGLWGSLGMTWKALEAQYQIIRSDVKKAKGRPNDDIFS